MKIRKLAFLFVCCFLVSSVSAQDKIVGIKNIVKLKLQCDSLGCVTNFIDSKVQCSFYFPITEKAPDVFYYHENLSQKEFYDFTLRADRSVIGWVKVVTKDYVPALRDFIFCFKADDRVMYYYIVEDRHKQSLEERKLSKLKTFQ